MESNGGEASPGGPGSDQAEPREGVPPTPGESQYVERSPDMRFGRVRPAPLRRVACLASGRRQGAPAGDFRVLRVVNTV